MTLPMTVTIFSRYQTGEETHFVPTVLSGVLYRPYLGRTLNATGPAATGKTGTLWIPARSGRRSPDILAAASDKTGLFTLLPGDYILTGNENLEEITGSIREKCPDARRILSVTERIYGTNLDHWEVEIG